MENWSSKTYCLAAVQQDGYALQFVKEQTPEICLAVVRQNGYALRFVQERTPELRKTAKREVRFRTSWESRPYVEIKK